MKKIIFIVAAAVVILSGCSANTNNNGGNQANSANQETVTNTNTETVADTNTETAANTNTTPAAPVTPDPAPTDKPASTTPPADKPADAPAAGSKDSLTVDDLVFSQLSAEETVGMWSGAVDIENAGDSDYQLLLFTVSFYKGDTRLGTATGALNGGLSKGNTKTAQFISTDDLTGYDTVKIQVDSKPGSSSKPADKPAKAPAGDSKDGITVDDLVFSQVSAKGVMGMWTGAVDVSNAGDTDYQMLLFTVSFYKGETRLGTATGALDGGLSTGDTKTAQFVSTDDLTGYDSVKIQVDSKM